jgi:hypothetical protein
VTIEATFGVDDLTADPSALVAHEELDDACVGVSA